MEEKVHYRVYKSPTTVPILGMPTRLNYVLYCLQNEAYKNLTRIFEDGQR